MKISAALTLLHAGCAVAFSPAAGGALAPSTRARATPLLKGPEFSAAQRAAARAARGNKPNIHEDVIGEALRLSRPPPSASTVGMSQHDQILDAQQNQLLGNHPAAYQPTPDVPQLDGALVAQVLEEFVKSDYARTVCDYCNVQPMSYGNLRGMFEEVKLVDSKIVLRLNDAFQQRAEQILGRLVKHLRARMPGQVRMVQNEQRSPPSTKTYIV